MKKIIFIVLGFIVLFFVALLVSPEIKNQIEKYLLKAPGGYKTISNPQLVESTISGKVRYPHDYTLVLLGDSMTANLGDARDLKGYLNQYYPQKTFEVLNYGYGSTNILSAKERLEKNTYHQRDFRAINTIDYDLILIESFGHNPLSEFELEEGLKKQTKTLDEIIDSLKKSGSEGKIVFVATIAPNRENYGKGITVMTEDKRKQWADERIAYIKNHIKYAKDHNIPIIDIYNASLDKNGSGKLIYVNDNDYIHPSPTGVLFISKQIAESIFRNNLLKI